MRYTTLITPEQLLPHLAESDWAVFDCRFKLEDVEAGRRAYLAAHIPGAVYAHLDNDLSGPKTGSNGRHPLPSPEAMIATFSVWGIGPETQVVAYDDQYGGMGAARLWWMLRYMGHDRAAVLDGGWQAWAAAFPARSGSESRPPARFTGQPRPDMIREADEVGALAQSSSWKVIDSRALPRYRGDEEPLDPVAGHIPGAKHFYWQNIVGLEGRTLSPDELRQKLQDLLGETPPDHCVFYCGSGVSAAANLLAMEAAGLHGAKLYPGSWSEWSSDPKRPVATGDS
jgi:thiosulfate/3-mercaptopyruvate sulfurtransferase